MQSSFLVMQYKLIPSFGLSIRLLNNFKLNYWLLYLCVCKDRDLTLKIPFISGN